MSRKVHSEHIVATKVLMPVGGGGCPGKCTLGTLLLQKCSCPLGGGRESALCDIYGEEHYFENRLAPPPPPSGKEHYVTYMGKSTILKIGWHPPPLRERALCDIYGEEHYFENRLGPPLPP